MGHGATYPGGYTCNDIFKGWVRIIFKSSTLWYDDHPIEPGWQDVSWRAWKSLSRGCRILPQSSFSIPPQIASNHQYWTNGQSTIQTNSTAQWEMIVFWGQNYFDCLQEIRPVPVYCNQWGVKHLVPEHLGRRQYVRDLVNLFQVLCLYSRWSERHNFHGNVFYQDYGIHSTYWIWRSYSADEWTGFEMVWSLTSFALQDSLMGGLVTQNDYLSNLLI